MKLVKKEVATNPFNSTHTCVCTSTDSWRQYGSEVWFKTMTILHSNIKNKIDSQIRRKIKSALL